MPVRIIIYEDSNTLRDSISSLLQLNNEYIVTGSFANCGAIEKNISELPADVILMDIDLPEISGIEAVKKIRALNKEVFIIMITIFDDDIHVYDALRAGANGYLLKKHISDKLSASILEVLNGGAPMSPAIAKLIIQNMHVQEVKDSKDYHLTNREREILSILAKGNSYKMIAAALSLSIDTVRTHIKRIYDKLHVNSQIEAVSKAINEKLVR